MRNTTILLVEDNQLIRWSMTRMLSREGFVVVAPPTAKEGLRLGATCRFDLLVTDWQLRDGHDGFQILATVRRSFPDTASILISSNVNAELTRKGIVAGFDRIIQKPLEAADVLGLIQGWAGWEGLSLELGQ